jgi:8-oxo-dGTP diphosphatase
LSPSDDWRYCPQCAGVLAHRELSGRRRPVCDQCGFIYFADPKVTVGLLIERAGRVLLGRRAVDPGRGLWCLPGGFVDYGERLREAAEREALEETGLVVQVGDLLAVWDFDDGIGGKKGIAIFFRAEAPAGEAAASDDLEALGWFEPGTVPELAFPLHEKLLHEWASQ